MAVFQSSGGLATQASTTGNALVQPTVTNTAIPLAGTEVAIPIPTEAKSIEIRARGPARLQIAYVATESGTNYFTLHAGCSYREENLSLNPGTTLYIQSSRAGETVELLYWT